MSDVHNKSQFLTIVFAGRTVAFLFLMSNRAINNSLNPARILQVSLKAAMLLMVLFCARLFAQSEKLVWMKAPDGRAYTTICTAEHCEIQQAAPALDLVDPEYVHDRKQERKTFCKSQRLKHQACSLSFRREETIQTLLRSDWIVSEAGDMSTMTRKQAEELVDRIKK